MELITINSDGTQQGTEALLLYHEISSVLKTTAENFVELCGKLKQMRDSRLYEHLGFENFEEYAEKAHNIKQRQAYNYIQAYEQHSGKFLEENARIGISKLVLLTQLSGEDKHELVQNNDLAGMTVADVKKLIAEHQTMGEQISLLTSKKEPIDVAAVEVEKINAAVEKALSEERTLQDLQKKKIKDDAAAKLKAEKDYAEKKIFEAVEKEKVKIIEDTTAKVKTLFEEQNRATLSEFYEAKAKAEKLERELQLSKNDSTVRFSILFTQLQEVVNSCNETIEQIAETDEATAQKFRGALKKVLTTII